MLLTLFWCRERAGGVTTAWQVARQQDKQPRHAHFRQWTVADIFARKGFLVHLRAHIARIDPVDAPVRVFGGQDVGKLFERGLAGTIAAPALIRLDSRVA